MYTAIRNGYETMRYFDYTRAEVMQLAREWAGDGAELAIFRNGGGWAFPFGRYGKKIYERTVRLRTNNQPPAGKE